MAVLETQRLLLGMIEVAIPAPDRGQGGLWLRAGSIALRLVVEPGFGPTTAAHPAFRVDDLKALAARLAAHGYARRA